MTRLLQKHAKSSPIPTGVRVAIGDPSHLFWMGGDPLVAVDALGDAIHHAHAKDTFINEGARHRTGLLETIEHQNVKARSWNYITLVTATTSNGGESFVIASG